MTEPDDDLKQFIAMLPLLLAEHLPPERAVDNPTTLPQLRKALDESDVSNLALETIDMPDPLRWLTATVTAVAHTSPSLAFVLASRYTGQRALAANQSGGSAAAEVTAGTLKPAPDNAVDAGPSSVVLIPDLFEPSLLLALDPAERTAAILKRVQLDTAHQYSHTGLAGARLEHVLGSSVTVLDREATTTALHEWTVLTAAVSLGIAEAARDVAEKYAAERQQFGSALLSFAALRAMLAEMHIRIAGVTALLERAITEKPTTAAASEAWAAAGRTAVDIALDAIQIHGGYGYIDEYPVADLLRDAISVRARGAARRSAVAAIATERLGALR